jgi:hypothetical protein
MENRPRPVLLFTASSPGHLEELLENFFATDKHSSLYTFGTHTAANNLFTVSLFLKSINYEKHHA